MSHSVCLQSGPNLLKRRLAITKIISILLCILFSANGFARSSSNQLSKKARNLIAKKQYSKAESVLSSSLAQNPGHRPSLVLMARLKYRQGNASAAARYFRKAGLDAVPKDAYYEAGASFYSAKNYYTALRYFRKVPSRSKAKPMANFFAGICFIQLKNYFQAEVFLRKARNVPASIKKSRRAFLKLARSRANSERFGGRFGRRPNYYQIPTPAQAPPLQPLSPQYPGGVSPESLYQKRPDQPQAKATQPKIAVPTERPKLGFYSAVSSDVKYSTEKTSEDRHAYAQKEIEKQGPSASADASFFYFNSPKDLFGNFGGDVGLVWKNLTSKTKLIESKQQSGNTFSTQEESDSIDKKFTFYGGPSFALNLSKSTSLSFAASVGYQTQGDGGDDKYSAYSTIVDLKGDYGDLGIEATFDYTSVSEVDNKAVVAPTEGEKATPVVLAKGSITAVSGGFSYDFESSSIEAKGSYSSNAEAGKTEYAEVENFNEGIDGFASQIKAEATYSTNFESTSFKASGSYLTNESPANIANSGNYEEYKLTGELGWSLEFGIALTLSAYYAQVPFLIKDNVIVDRGDVSTSEDDTKAQVQAAKDRVAAKFLTKVAPSEWFFAEGSFEYIQDKYTVPSATQKVGFEQSVPDLIFKYKLTLGAQLSF